MNSQKQYIFLLSLALLFCCIVASAGQNQIQEPFSDAELTTLCNQLPGVLDSLNDQEKHQYFIEVMNHYEDTFFQREPARTFPSNIDSKRFNYILNHIILGGVIKDMGGFGKDKISFLKTQIQKVKKDSHLSASHREAILEELKNSLRQVELLHIETQTIPKSELYLMWQRKKQLNDLLLGIVPIEKKQMIAR